MGADDMIFIPACIILIILLFINIYYINYCYELLFRIPVFHNDLFHLFCDRQSELTQHVSVLESAGADLNPVEYIKKWK